MRYKLRTATLAFLTLLIISVSMWAKQVTQKTETLVINGQTGQAAVIHVDGRAYVDLTALAQIANWSVSFEANRIVLGPAPNPASAPETVGLANPRRRLQPIAGVHACWDGSDSADEGVGQPAFIRYSEWISSDRKLGCRLPRTGRACSQSRIGGSHY